MVKFATVFLVTLYFLVTTFGNMHTCVVDFRPQKHNFSSFANCVLSFIFMFLNFSVIALNRVLLFAHGT